MIRLQTNIWMKGARKLGVLMRFRNSIPKIHIYTYLYTYCYIVRHQCRSSDARKVERLQERALRAIYCDRSSTYKALLKKAKIRTLRNRRLQDIGYINVQG